MSEILFVRVRIDFDEWLVVVCVCVVFAPCVAFERIIITSIIPSMMVYKCVRRSSASEYIH